jgi:hypothetical protein
LETIIAIGVFSFAVAVVQFILGDRKDKGMAIATFGLVVATYFATKDTFSQGNKIENSTDYLVKLQNIDDSITKHISKLDSLNHILDSLNNSLAVNIDRNVNTNLKLTSDIKDVDNDIQNVSRNILAVSGEIKDITARGNSCPEIEFNYRNASPGFANIWIRRRGGYSLQSVEITMTDYEKLSDLGRFPNKKDNDLFQTKYQRSFINDNEILDSIRIKSWDKYPLQRFNFYMVTLNGFYVQSYCLKKMSDGSIGEAYLLKTRFTQITIDSLLPKEFLEHGEKEWDIFK